MLASQVGTLDSMLSELGTLEETLPQRRPTDDQGKTVSEGDFVHWQGKPFVVLAVHTFAAGNHFVTLRWIGHPNRPPLTLPITDLGDLAGHPTDVPDVEKRQTLAQTWPRLGLRRFYRARKARSTTTGKWSLPLPVPKR
jgi:hypothetical protein